MNRTDIVQMLVCQQISKRVNELFPAANFRVARVSELHALLVCVELPPLYQKDEAVMLVKNVAAEVANLFCIPFMCTVEITGANSAMKQTQHQDDAIDKAIEDTGYTESPTVWTREWEKGQKQLTRGNFVLARTHFKKAYLLVVESFGLHSKCVPLCLKSIAFTFMEQKLWRESLPHFEKAANIERNLYGDSESLAETMRAIGLVLQKMGQLELSKKHFCEAIEIYRRLAAAGEE